MPRLSARTTLLAFRRASFTWATESSFSGRMVIVYFHLLTISKRESEKTKRPPTIIDRRPVRTQALKHLNPGAGVLRPRRAGESTPLSLRREPAVYGLVLSSGTIRSIHTPTRSVKH